MGINDFLQIGDRFKFYRKKAHLTQLQMAEKLNIPRSTYANYESNKREPTSDIIIKFCNLFNIAPSTILASNSYSSEIINDELLSLESDMIFTHPVTNDSRLKKGTPSPLIKREPINIESDTELYNLFQEFLLSKTLQENFDYNPDDISYNLEEIYKFMLDMLYLKITEIKYSNAKQSYHF